MESRSLQGCAVPPRKALSVHPRISIPAVTRRALLTWLSPTLPEFGRLRVIGPLVPCLVAPNRAPERGEAINASLSLIFGPAEGGTVRARSLHRNVVLAPRAGNSAGHSLAVGSYTKKRVRRQGAAALPLTGPHRPPRTVLRYKNWSAAVVWRSHLAVRPRLMARLGRDAVKLSRGHLSDGPTLRMLDHCRQCTVTRSARTSLRSRRGSKSGRPIEDATRGHYRGR